MKVPQEDIYEKVRQTALRRYPQLLEEWLPGGKVISGEYTVLNPTRADHDPNSFKINIRSGKWQDFACGDKGGDAISLYAYLRCGGVEHRVEACRILAEKFGLDGGTPPKTKPNLRVVKADPEWKSQVPPPPDTGRPNIPRCSRLHTYRGPDGEPWRFVARVENGNGSKDFYPHTYGTLDGKPGWYSRHPNEPICLYGLDRRATNPSLRILLQEGELKADLVQDKVSSLVCMAWSGGANFVAKHDYGPVAGAEVIVCGDAVDGEKAMMTAAEILAGKGCSVWTLDLSDYPEKWDLGNAATGRMVKRGQVLWEDPDGPWSGEKIAAFIEARMKPYIPDTGDVDGFDLEPPDDDAEWREDGGNDNQERRSRPPIPLGHDRNIYYYLSPMQRQIVALSPSQHTAQNLTALADLNGFWMRRDNLKNKEGGIKWTEAAAELMSFCTDIGIYKPELARGRGAWMEDDGRPVLNMGEHLNVRGEICPLPRLPKSRYVYEAGPRLNFAIADPISAASAAELLQICQMLPWEKPIYATLMAGWMVVAPLCGALFYRPAIWLTGGSGSGKSTLESRIVRPVLGGFGRRVQGGTTEAGIRQMLGVDALPVVFDEAEAENQHGKIIMQNNLSLVRQSTSEGGAEIIKGTQSQTGVKRYHMRSCFMFSSINVYLENRADESRVTVLELKNAAGRDGQAAFDELQGRIDTTIRPEYCAGLIARNVYLLPTILENAHTFSRAVATHLNSARVGDQIGTMLAGAYTLGKDSIVSPKTAMMWVRDQDWGDTTSADAMTDERRMLNHLMQRRVRLDLGDNRFRDLTLAELVRFAADEPPSLSGQPGQGQKELLRNGLKYEDGGVWISNTHTALKEHLKDTPWSSQWSRTLRRLPGTKPLNREEPGIKFAGELARATFVPLDLI